MLSEYLVVYDIADNKRINKTAAILLDYGVRVQRSVFEIRLEDTQLPLLKSRLLAVLEPELDGIKIFKLCENCRIRKGGVGAAEHLQKIPQWLIV